VTASNVPAPPDAPHSEREAQLARVPFFEGLTAEALSLIANATTEESHATGTKIFQYGDVGDKLFVLLEGRVRISREVAGMGEEALAVLGPGEGPCVRGPLELRENPFLAPAGDEREAHVPHDERQVLTRRYCTLPLS
jgi:hypothetical protein